MASTLEQYRKKRHFKASPEPTGGRRHANTALRFVIQRHAAKRLHYDFRLELDGALKSWAIPKGPSLDPSVKRMAVHVEDHPIEYAAFEGVIPAGQYGAGTVIVWDSGTWEAIGDAANSYAEGKIKFILHGKKLRGHWMLVRMHGRDDERQEPWLLIKERDSEARSASQYDVVEALPDSVLAGSKKVPARTAVNAAAKSAAKSAAKAAVKPSLKTGQNKVAKQDPVKALIDQARKSSLPLALAPQLATLAEAPPTAGDWFYEIKFDGYRILARIDGDDVRLFTRNGHDWTSKLRDLAAKLRAMKLEPCWLDGEIVIANQDGRSDFQALQNAFEAKRSGATSAIQYYIFDMPYYGGRDLRGLQFSARRTVLSALIKPSAQVRVSEVFHENVDHLLATVCTMQLEGLVGKRADAIYTSSRNRSWIKLKCQRRQEFVIGGYTDPKGSRAGLGALLVGVYDKDGALRYAGNVGTGFSEATLFRLRKKLDAITIARSPFANAPAARSIHWVKPQLVGEVSFAEWTSEDRLRHAVFHGLRSDKDPNSITRELAGASVGHTSAKSRAKPAHKLTVKTPSTTSSKPASKAASQTAAEAASVSPHARQQESVRKTTNSGATTLDGIAISHADRVIDPSSGLTKGDLVHYYQEVAALLLPHLKDRPVSLLRAPQGLTGKQIFQRHGELLRIPGLEQLAPNLWPKHPPLIAIRSSAGIVGAAQMNAIELHTWNACTDSIDRPDRLIFDLDPGEGLAFDGVVEATQLTMGFLDALGLKAFVKTSGGKGMHVVVPIARRYEWDAAKDFSAAVVRHLAQAIPERFVAKSGPKNRIGRVFVDFLRNGRGATTACAFSARAREGLGVSMPIDEAQLKDLDSASQWTIANAMAWLNQRPSDPWRDYKKSQQQRLEAAAKKLGHKWPAPN